MAVVALTSSSLLAEEEDQPISIDKVPAPVAAAMQQAAAGAELIKITSGEEDGKPVFEARWKSGGHAYEISVDPTGKVLDLEKKVSLSELPAAVSQAFTTEAAGARLGTPEEVQADGKTTYEIEIGHKEVTADASGAILKRESGDEEEGGQGEKGEKEEKD